MSGEKILTDGLLEGYAGNTKSDDVSRGLFDLKSSILIPLDSNRRITGYYIDQWIVGKTVGGGQEIAQQGYEKTTRVYAGGTLPIEELERIGLTPKDVTGYLKRKITELGEKTRLGERCLPEPDGDWQYEYQILDFIPEIELNIGLETIHYKGGLVFAHGVLKSPVE